MSYDRLLAELDCMTPGQAALFNQPETETYTGRAAAAIRALRAELDNSNDAADKWRDLFVSNEKAIARVRELVRGRWVSVDDLQSALEGNQP